MLSEMPALLLELWREQHPRGHEQTVLNFASAKRTPQAIRLAFHDEAGK